MKNPAEENKSEIIQDKQNEPNTKSLKGKLQQVWKNQIIPIWEKYRPAIILGSFIGGTIITVISQLSTAQSNNDNVVIEDGITQSAQVLDEELLSKYPPGDPSKRKPNSKFAKQRRLSPHEMYTEARDLGLLDENMRLTPTGEQYGDSRITRDGYPYIAWDSQVNRMVCDKQQQEAQERKAQKTMRE